MAVAVTANESVFPGNSRSPKRGIPREQHPEGIVAPAVGRRGGVGAVLAGAVAVDFEEKTVSRCSSTRERPLGTVSGAAALV